VVAVEKSIALSVIVPTIHGVVYRDALLVIFPASESLESCQERMSERADERAK